MKEVPRSIIKRDGSLVNFDADKITDAIHAAGLSTGEFDRLQAHRLMLRSLEKIQAADYRAHLSVEQVQDLVEETLMESAYKVTAKAYILYRQERGKNRQRHLFKRRLILKPYEYPELAEYVDAIRHSYWIHTEFNYTSDIQDYRINVNDAERTGIKNAMLAIAQVEVSVKTFWGDIYKHIPKPEIGQVGYTFAESEVRHSDAYSHLLEILGLNREFNKIKDIPAIMNRIQYLENSLLGTQSDDPRDYTLAILLFSLFTEHVSLFSQFLIIMAFNKHRNLFKGISNAIEATSKEEQIHGLFGIDLINVIRHEHPEWFDDDMEKKVMRACEASYEAERNLLDWIFEDGELEFLSKNTIQEFIKNRLNNSLESIGYPGFFPVDEDEVAKTDWFDDEVVATKHVDFFVKRSINYSKRTQSFTSDDLF